ncbi:MAG: uroporphyrinogen decarboxylase (URO-D) [Actinomycetia bacterium]|nr:uroporphyrinogen decarboxylase (URO-D) [Actinomycetes bacterium]
MTAVEILNETLKKDGRPPRLLLEWEPFVQMMNDPIQKFTRGNRAKGQDTLDRWGTTISWPDYVPAAMPFITEENKVCKDITEWQKYVHVPDIMPAVNEPGAWDDVLQLQKEIREQGLLSMAFMGTGMFEQLHYLLGMEDALVALMVEPDYTDELLDVIFKFRCNYAQALIDHLHPDVILSHDDWGSHDSLFFSPEIWRKFFKERYRQFYKLWRDAGILVIHHGDSYCEPITLDMAEIGVQIWQGVLPQNNIVKMQKELAGSMVLMGGIDSVIDHADQTEAEIRQETRRACEAYAPGGHFIPSLTYGGKDGALFPMTDPMIKAEIASYNHDVYGI